MKKFSFPTTASRIQKNEDKSEKFIQETASERERVLENENIFFAIEEKKREILIVKKS